MRKGAEHFCSRSAAASMRTLCTSWLEVVHIALGACVPAELRVAALVENMVAPLSELKRFGNVVKVDKRIRK